jgi:Protein of unknown function (DUF2800)
MNADKKETPPTAPLTDAERPHHPYSPSSLQNREACPCYKNRDSANEAAIAGTLQHRVVETGEDDNTLSDDRALAAADCLDYYLRQKEILEEARRREDDQLQAEARRTGAAMYVPPREVLDLKEIYLPVDTCAFGDTLHGQPVVTEGTTAGYVDRALIAHTRKFAILLDWKFGAWEVEHAKDNLQGISYVLGLFKLMPTLEEIRFVFKQPHLDLLTEHTFHRREIPTLYLRVQVVVARARDASMLAESGDFSMATPKVPACNFCARIGQCPKVIDYACKVGHKFAPLDIPSDVTPSTVKNPHDTTVGLRLAQVMAVWSKAFKTQITDRIFRTAGSSGAMPIPPGYEMVTKRDRELDSAEKFKQVALGYLTEKELAPLAKYTFGSVEEAIALNAPRGSKKSTVEEFQSKLIETGAVKLGDPYSYLKATSEKKSEKDPAP